MAKAVNIHVFGRVQGVGFRYSALQKALTLNVTGYVKNEMDGSVFIVAEGEIGKINEFIGWCKQGPVYSEVSNIDVIDSEIMKYSRFEIRR